MAIKEIVFDGKIWIQKVILSYKVTGVPNSSGVAWVYKENTTTNNMDRDWFNSDYSPALANGTLLEVDSGRLHKKDWSDNWQYFRKITKCPDYPMVVGDYIAESDITKIDN